MEELLHHLLWVSALDDVGGDAALGLCGGHGLVVAHGSCCCLVW